MRLIVTSLLVFCVVLLATCGFASSQVQEQNMELERDLPPQRTVLVFGANGNTGKRIIRRLKTEGSGRIYRPIAVVRNANQSKFFANQGVEARIADLEYPLDFLFANNDVDVVIFTAGSGSNNPDKNNPKTVLVDHLGAIRAFVAAQQASSVRRFILLSGTNVASDSNSPIAHWHRAKFFADNWIREQSHMFGRAIDFTIVCPSRLTNAEPDTAGFVDVGPEIVVSRDDESIVSRGGVYRPSAQTSRENTAAVIVASIDEKQTFNRTFRVLDGKVPVVDALKSL